MHIISLKFGNTVKWLVRFFIEASQTTIIASHATEGLVEPDVCVFDDDICSICPSICIHYILYTVQRST